MQNAQNYLLTTIDNPYNPFVDWDSWFAFDEQKGYHTCQVLDKFYKTSDLIPESLDIFLYSDALDTILELFWYYIVVTKDSVIKPINLDLVEQNLNTKTG